MRIEGIDEIDNKILNIIKDNARLSYKEIGEQAGISRVSVRSRMDALQEKGIIKGFQTIIDPTSAPEGTRFFMDIECVPEFYEEVVEYLASSKMIRQIYCVSGECRIHTVGFSPNTKSLNYFSRTLYQSLRGVRRIGCHTVLCTLMDVDGGVDYEKCQKHEHMEGRAGSTENRQ